MTLLLEATLVLAVLAVGLLPAVRATRRRRRVFWSAVAVTFVGVGFVETLERRADRAPVGREVRPVETESAGYVSSEACQACHPDQYDSWRGSYHRTMTQVATPENVVGDFDGVDLELDGRRYRLERRGEQLWARIGGADGSPGVWRRIVLSTGSHHDQMYWHGTPGGGNDLRMFPFDYSLRLKRWIPVRASFIQPPGAPSVRPRGEWNVGCSTCHSTHPETRHQATAGGGLGLDTRVAEFGIACESCHGPAEEHVRVNQNPLRRYDLHVGDERDPTVVNPSRLPYDRASEICAQCHGIWVASAQAMSYRPGDDMSLRRHYVQHRFADPAFRTDEKRRHQAILASEWGDPEHRKPSFWSDGMVRVSGREYNGLVESPCFERGTLSCLSCHSMHKPADDPRPLPEWASDQLAHGMEGNDACRQCHAGFEEPEQVAAHSHHAADSAGSLCYNCHMPFTSYGIQKAHRSHQVSVPSVAESLETGRPNACNQCHLDRTLGWTGEWLAEWYGTPAPALDEEQRTLAASALWTLRGDAGQRALMAWSMSWEPALEASGSDWVVPYLAQLLDDPYDSVRFIAWLGLSQRPRFAEFPYDFVGSPEHRRAAAEQARAAAAPAPEAGRAVLHDPAGQLLTAEFQRLLYQRDDTPVSLRE